MHLEFVETRHHSKTYHKHTNLGWVDYAYLSRGRGGLLTHSRSTGTWFEGFSEVINQNRILTWDTYTTPEYMYSKFAFLEYLYKYLFKFREKSQKDL